MYQLVDTLSLLIRKGPALISLAVLALLAIAIPLLAVGLSGSLGPVSRQRVATFARRQALLITPDNGNAVIAYLATTRRWRAAGLAVGFVASVVWSFGNGFSIGTVQLIAGWFAGAVIAEWRIHRLPPGARISASLQPRLAAAYVSAAARAVPLLVAGISVATAGVSVGVNMSGRAGATPQVVSLAAVAVLLAAVGRVVEGRILDRPQPFAAADVLAADDAIRSRSLRVLVGAIGTLATYCVVAQLGFLSHGFPVGATHSTMTYAQIVLWLVGTLFGRAMGTSPWAVRRPVEAVPAA